jgi:glycosyltransferase involved in cell wall biosynthesis
MQPQPLVSIVTPAYNAAHFIRATIRSVLAQTYPHWEWIIVDDGSTDATATIVATCDDARVRLVRGGRTGLPAAARNAGLRRARAELVAFLDADDLWRPELLATQLAYLAAHPTVGLVFSRYYVWVDRHLQARQVVPDTRDLPNPGNMLPALCLHNYIGPSSVVVRRALLDAVGGFDEDRQLRGVEDYDLWLRLAERTLFGCVDRPLYWYRIHSGNLSANERHIAEGRILAVERALARCPDLRRHPQLSGAALAAHQLHWRARSLLLDGADDCGRRMFAQSLRIRPLNRDAWIGLALSMLGARGIRMLRRLSRRMW